MRVTAPEVVVGAEKIIKYLNLGFQAEGLAVVGGGGSGGGGEGIGRWGNTKENVCFLSTG